MKKLIFAIILCFIWTNIPSPGHAKIYISQPKFESPYEAIWEAICQYESRNDPMAYNPKEDAVGIAQIRPIRIKDYNERTGKNYKLVEMYDVEKSKEVFMHYATHLHHRNKIIRKWNGSGPQSYKYLAEILKIIEENS